MVVCLSLSHSSTEGLFYRMSFMVSDSEASRTELEIEKTVSQWVSLLLLLLLSAHSHDRPASTLTRLVMFFFSLSPFLLS